MLITTTRFLETTEWMKIKFQEFLIVLPHKNRQYERITTFIRILKFKVILTNWFRHQFYWSFGDWYCWYGSHSERFCSCSHNPRSSCSCGDNSGSNSSCWSNRFNNLGSNGFHDLGSDGFCSFCRCKIVSIGFVRFGLLYFPVVTLKKKIKIRCSFKSQKMINRMTGIFRFRAALHG